MHKSERTGIDEKTYNSFNDTGELAKIEESTRYMPNYKQEAQIKKQAADVAVEKKIKQIAKQLRDSGFTIDQVVQLTGISQEEAEKIKSLKKGKRL